MYMYVFMWVTLHTCVWLPECLSAGMDAQEVECVILHKRVQHVCTSVPV